MHDPMTVAFEIPYPWWTHRPWPKGVAKFEDMSPELQRRRSKHWRDGYRETFITIWHVDPERDGSDDSCGWSYPKVPKDVRERARREGRSECTMEHAGLFKKVEVPAGCVVSKRDPVATTFLVFQIVAWRVWRWTIRPRDLPEIMSLATSNIDGFYDSFDGPKTPLDIEATFGWIARSYLRMRRPWWKHPRWHVHHWRIQCQLSLRFKRWAFSRCCKCGKRFTWGYSPVTCSWNSKGPRWFRGETDIFHSDCDRPSASSGLVANVTMVAP